MSRKINLSQPLSPEDIEYLKQRDQLPADYKKQEESELEELSLDELKAIARAKSLPVSGSKAELIERIENA